jgi:hypothetical protein
MEFQTCARACVRELAIDMHGLLLASDKSKVSRLVAIIHLLENYSSLWPKKSKTIHLLQTDPNPQPRIGFGVVTVGLVLGQHGFYFDGLIRKQT